MRIDDNLDIIRRQQEENKDYLEYRYRYIFMQPIPHYVHTGKTTTMYYTYIPIPHYSWTQNSEQSNLTGEERLCHYVYTAYKIEKDEHGKFVLIPSAEVDDITKIKDEFPFIKKKWYKAIDIKYGTDLDYEDGPSELSPEEQKEQDIEYADELQNENTTNTNKILTKK